MLPIFRAFGADSSRAMDQESSARSSRPPDAAQGILEREHLCVERADIAKSITVSVRHRAEHRSNKTMRVPLDAAV
jgi:hypothetical protein